MSERLRKFKDLTEEIRILKKPQEDANGRRMVRIGIADSYDLLSPLSPNGEPYITSDTAQFLEQSICALIHRFISFSKEHLSPVMTKKNIKRPFATTTTTSSWRLCANLQRT